jgi:hypothetical protein
MPLENVKPSKSMDVLELLKNAQKSGSAVGGSDAPKPAPRDQVVFEQENTVTAPIPKKHNIKVLKLADPAQLYPFLTECTCGFQGRNYTVDQAKQAAANHIENAQHPSTMR